MHYNLLVFDRLSSSRLFIIILILNGFVVSTLVILLFYINSMIPSNPVINIFSYDQVGNSDYFLVQFFFTYLTDMISVIILLSFLGSLRIVHKIYLISKNAPVRMELLHLSCFIIYRSLFLLRSLLRLPAFSLITVIGLIFLIIGIIILLVNYIIHIDYLYLLPFPIHNVLIYNMTGSCVYSRYIKVSAFQDEGLDGLVSGIFSAISSLVEETLGQGSRLKHLDADQYQIYFIPLPKQSGTLAVITSGASSLLQDSLKRFAKTIPNKIIDKIVAIGTNIHKLRPEMDELIQRNFPYVQLETEKGKLK